MDSGLLDVRALIGLLVRQRRVVIVSFLAVVVVAAAVIFTLQPRYTATAMVLVDPSSKNVLDAGVPRGDVSDSSRVDSEVLIAQSRDVLEAVSAQLDLASEPEFAVAPGRLAQVLAFLRLRDLVDLTSDQRFDAVVSRLAESVSVRRVGVTFVLAVSAQSADADLGARIANEVANTYIAFQVRRKVATMTASRDVIEARIAEASQAIQRSEDALSAFTNIQLDLISGSTDNNSVVAFKTRIAQLVDERDSLDRDLGRLNSSIASQDWTSLSDLIGSTSFRSLDERRLALEASFDGLADNSVTVGTLRDQLTRIRAELLSEAGREAVSLGARVAAADGQLSGARAGLREALVSADLPTSVLGEIYQLQQAAEIARQQYQVLLARLNQLNTQAYLQVADSTVVAQATPPSTASFPKTRLLLVVATALAAGLAIAAAILVDSYVGGFSSASQIEAVLRTEVASSVPRLKLPKRTETGEESTTIADLVLDAPLSSFTEAIRRVRLGIQRATRKLERKAGEGTVILVTSTAPGEGKTSLALALARSYAVAGKRCLLVDCDLREPDLHNHLGLHRDAGLMEFLLGQRRDVSLDSIVYREARTGVNVIVGSQRSSTATDHFVTGSSFAGLIAAARQVFDVIVLDAPPVMPVVDSLYLAPYADAIVFVSKWAATLQADAKSAVRLLDDERRADVEILTVLNQVEKTDLSTSRYASSYEESDTETA